MLYYLRKGDGLYRYGLLTGAWARGNLCTRRGRRTRAIMLQLRKASIVIRAQSHNPTIISPGWVQKALLIKEPPSNFVCTPPFSLFDSASFLLTVDTERLELVPKVLDEEHISVCGQAASAYFRTLPHIPYRSLGLNYIWAYSPKPTGKPLPRVKVVIDELDLSRVFNGRSIKYGGTVRVELRPYVLTVRIDYEDDQTIVFNYNFSYVIESFRKAANLTKPFLLLRSRSQELTESMLPGGKAGNG